MKWRRSLGNIRKAKKLFWSVLFLAFCLEAFEKDEAILEVACKELSHVGVIRCLDGFVYVDVDDAYIHTLLPYLSEEGFEMPPYFGQVGLVGGHITIIDAGEITCCDIQECGQSVSFTPIEGMVVSPPSWKGIEKAYLIIVEAPELDEIRMTHGLSLRKYPYHITIGVKRVE